MGALAAFQILTSGRATGPLEFLIALGVGLMWGVWVRWFPVVSDEHVPAAEIGPALLALGIGLAACGAIRVSLPPAGPYNREDWLLTPVEWALSGGALVAALGIGVARDDISRAGLGVVLTLIAFILIMLYTTLPLRQKKSLLDGITPPRRPNLAAWLLLIVPFLLAGWIGYHLPGSGESSAQSDLLFGALTGVGIVWLPVVSSVIGVRAFIQLAREGG
jgi:hypothetical protein